MGALTARSSVRGGRGRAGGLGHFVLVARDRSRWPDPRDHYGDADANADTDSMSDRDEATVSSRGVYDV